MAELAEYTYNTRGVSEVHGRPGSVSLSATLSRLQHVEWQEYQEPRGMTY